MAPNDQLPAGSEQHTGPLEPKGRAVTQRRGVFGDPDVAKLTPPEVVIFEDNLSRIDEDV